MNFSKLMQFASVRQKTSEKTTEKPKLMSVKLSAPKKEEKKKKGILSDNVRAFLEKKEKEEMEKKKAEARKKEALLVKRKDMKHETKAKAMATRTKENPKGLSETEIYLDKYEGLLEKKYVSHDADARKKAILEEMAEKAARVKEQMANSKNSTKIEIKSPSGEIRIKSNKSKEIVDDDFSDDDMLPPPPSEDLNEKPKTDYTYLLERRKAEEASEHKEERKRKKEKHRERHKDGERHRDREKSSKGEHGRNVESREKAEERREKKEKKARIVRRANQGKPVLSFEDLLKMAQSPKPEGSSTKATKNPIKPPKLGRPMTAEEKEREERKRSKEYQHWYKFGGARPQNHDMSDSEESDDEAPPARDRHFTDIKPNGAGKQAMTLEQKKLLMMRVNSALKTRPTPSGASSSTSSHSKPLPGADQSRKKLQLPGRPSDDPLKRPDCGLRAPIRPTNMNLPGRPVPKIASKPASFAAQAALMESREERESILVCGPSKPQTSSSTSSHKAERKRDKYAQRPDKPAHSPSEPQERMSAWDRIYSQVRKPKPKPGKRKHVIESESEEEYDDDFIDDDGDLDNFIDDSDAMDYSKHIRDIFGYDKNKYKNEREDDLRDMETNFATQMKEEVRSARLGMREDLEDIRREEEELKRAKMKKKMRR